MPFADGAARARRASSSAGGSASCARCHQTVYEVEANWKLFFHNYSECYHCPTVHPHLNKLTPYRNTENDLDEGPVLGGPMWMSNPEGSMTIGGERCAPPFAGLSAEERGRVYYYTVFPSAFLSFHPDYVLVHRAAVARHRPHPHRLRLVLPPRRDRRAGLRPAARRSTSGT